MRLQEIGSVEFVGFIVTRLWWLGLTVGQWLPDVSFGRGPIPARPSGARRMRPSVYPFFRRFHRLRPYHSIPSPGPAHRLAVCGQGTVKLHFVVLDQRLFKVLAPANFSPVISSPAGSIGCWRSVVRNRPNALKFSIARPRGPCARGRRHTTDFRGGSTVPHAAWVGDLLLC